MYHIIIFDHAMCLCVCVSAKTWEIRMWERACHERPDVCVFDFLQLTLSSWLRAVARQLLPLQCRSLFNKQNTVIKSMTHLRVWHTYISVLIMTGLLQTHCIFSQSPMFLIRQRRNKRHKITSAAIKLPIICHCQARLFVFNFGNSL